MQSAFDLLKGYGLPSKRKRVSERGVLLEYFAQKLDRPIPSFVSKLKGLKLADLYYIKSSCDGYERKGNPWSKGFWGIVKKMDVH